MPTSIKLILSIMVLGAAAILAEFHYRLGNGRLVYAIIGLAIVMVMSTWLFPEVKPEASNRKR
jgi:uncharacterized membrane protein YuzA (DUF378 family)